MPLSEQEELELLQLRKQKAAAESSDDDEEDDDSPAAPMVSAPVTQSDLLSYINQQRAAQQPPQYDRNQLPAMGGKVVNPPQAEMPAPFSMSPLDLNWDYEHDQPITGSPTAPQISNEDDSSGLNFPLGQRGQMTINSDPSYSSVDLLYRLWQKRQNQLYGQVGTDSEGNNNANLIYNRNF